MNEVLELSSFMKRVSNDSAENKDLQVALWRLLTCYKKTRAGLSRLFSVVVNFLISLKFFNLSEVIIIFC